MSKIYAFVIHFTLMSLLCCLDLYNLARLTSITTRIKGEDIRAKHKGGSIRCKKSRTWKKAFLQAKHPPPNMRSSNRSMFFGGTSCQQSFCDLKVSFLFSLWLHFMSKRGRNMILFQHIFFMYVLSIELHMVCNILDMISLLDACIQGEHT